MRAELGLPTVDSKQLQEPRQAKPRVFSPSPVFEGNTDENDDDSSALNQKSDSKHENPFVGPMDVGIILLGRIPVVCTLLIKL